MKEKIDWTSFLETLGSELYDSTKDAYKELLPQLADLDRVGNHYQSSYKLNGEQAKSHRPDKTVILENYPMVVIEHGDVARNLVKLVMEQQQADFITVVKQMADLVGMEMPKGDFDSQRWLEIQTKKEMLATVQEYYVWCLHNAKPEPILEYLHSRFTDEEIVKMGLGYIPSQPKLKEYLLGRGYDAAQIQSTLLDKYGCWIGNTHQISIPIYVAGVLKGHIFRHYGQQGTEKLRKYQYENRLAGEPQQNLQFFYIPSSLKLNPNVTIVEGQLDARHLGCYIPSVVATGTNAVNPEQVRDAVKRGAKSFTLLYDADPLFDKDGNPTPEVNYSHRSKALKTILDTLQDMGVANDVRLYVADLPQPDTRAKVDPDSYLHQYGAAAVKILIDGAEKGWQYDMRHLNKQYEGIDLAPKQLDTYVDAALAIYGTITAPIDQQEYRNAMEGWMQGVNGSTLDNMLQEYTNRRTAEQAKEQAAELQKQAAELMKQGDIAKSIELQNKAAVLATSANGDEEYNKLQTPTTRAKIVEELQAMPDVLHTGLYLGRQIEENEIILPSGAMSILAAPTSHGKTTMLVSMAVQAAKTNTDKHYYLLSYEEALAPITVKALSCYAGLELSASNKRTIQHYLTSGSTEYFYRDEEIIKSFKRQEQEYFKMLEDGRLHINYTEAYCETLCNNIRRLTEKRDVGAVFIDYVQYMELANVQSTYSRQEQIGRICRMLKDVAVDTGCPLVLGAQFNREVVDPTTLAITNIGDGGEIERKSAYVLGFWNNDMPYQTGKGTKDNREKILATAHCLYDVDNPNKNQSIYAMVLKNRSGIGAKAGANGLLAFRGNIGSVENMKLGDLETSTPNIHRKA